MLTEKQIKKEVKLANSYIFTEDDNGAAIYAKRFFLGYRAALCNEQIPEDLKKGIFRSELCEAKFLGWALGTVRMGKKLNGKQVKYLADSISKYDSYLN